MKNWVKAVIAFAVPQLVGLSGSLFTDNSEGSWFQTLAKPEWNPPGWVFGPVWTLLYILMGLALYLVWKSDAPPRLKRPALTLWVLQMIFNFLWSLLFFGMHQMDIAFYEIVALWILILLTIFAFARISKLAAWLLVPYISWVSFAALLNYSIWQMNS